MKPLDEDAIPRVVKNEWFYLVARVCMIVASTIGLPICGWMISRAVAKADEISMQIATQSIDIRLLQATVQFQFKVDGEKLTDHELRLRGMERGK